MPPRPVAGRAGRAAGAARRRWRWIGATVCGRQAGTPVPSSHTLPPVHTSYVLALLCCISLWYNSVVVKEETDVGGSSGGGAARVVSDAACSASDEHLWMLGWAQFSREERHRLAVQVSSLISISCCHGAIFSPYSFHARVLWCLCVQVARKRHGDVAADAVVAILALSMPTERTAAAAESAALPFLRIYQHMHHRPGPKSGATQPVYRSYTEAMAAMVKSRPAATAAASAAHSKTPPHPVAQLTAALAHLRADGVVKLVEPSAFAARGAAPVGGVDGPCYSVALAHVVTSQVTQQPADTHAASLQTHFTRLTFVSSHRVRCPSVSLFRLFIAAAHRVARRRGGAVRRGLGAHRGAAARADAHGAAARGGEGHHAREGSKGECMCLAASVSSPFPLLHHPHTHTIVTSSSQQERLYRLHRDGWIQYLEVARRPDFAPVSTSYFWFVDVPKVSERAHGPWPVRKARRLAHLLRVCRAPLLSPIAGARGGGTGPPFLGQHTGAAPPLLPIQAGTVQYDNAMY